MPLYFWVISNPKDTTTGWIRAYPGTGDEPAWDDVHFYFADFEMYPGPPMYTLIHTENAEQMDELHPELRTFIDNATAEIRSATSRLLNV